MDSVRKHPHYFRPGQCPRSQLFTSFISLIVFLFILIVVLLLSPHVHGTEDVPDNDDDVDGVYFDDEQDPEEASIESQDMIEERMDEQFKETVIKAAVARVKEIEEAKNSKKDIKLSKLTKTSKYELMSRDEISELLDMMEGGPKDKIKETKAAELVDKETITRRTSGGQREQRPRKPRDPPVTHR